LNDYTVKVIHQNGEYILLQKRPKIPQEGSLSLYVATNASWMVEVKKGEVAQGKELGVTRRGGGDLSRDKGTMAIILLAGKGRWMEGRIASRRRGGSMVAHLTANQ
jgi:hypothetical protein